MFPENDYTPFGYLDNPFHTWKLNRSGIFRVSPPVGFEWLFPNAYKPFLSAALNIGLLIDSRILLLPSDWQNFSISPRSPYHSKNVFRFTWQWQQFNVECDFFLADEKGLAAQLRVTRASASAGAASVLLLSSVQLKYRQTGLWDFGLTGSVKDDHSTAVLKSFAEGYCFTLKFSEECDQYSFGDEANAVCRNLSGDARPARFFSTTKEKIYSLIRIPIDFSHGDDFELNCLVTRGVSEHETGTLSHQLFPQLNAMRNNHVSDDAAFWDICPQLSGDWPGHWQRGWVYDWETLRMNVRRPTGIFTTEWDAMQIQKPRVVLAETALDMLMLSYADPERSQRVILGLFRDAPGPQVPCAREDGSLNMISEDGSECGTSPAWCWPFYCFQSIYDRQGDRDWLEALFPHLELYLNWWLQHRTDDEGWAVYNCSWESGQDDSTKFLIQQPTGGEVVSHLRAVDLQAAMAQAAAVMSGFSKVLGREPDKWDAVHQQFRDRTLTLWRKDWFCDFDRRTNSWVYKEEYRDITNLAPFFVGVYSESHLRHVEPWFAHFKTNRKLWLEWASFFFMYLEAIWRTGFRQLASDVLYETADRVYRNWDRRHWSPEEAMPGVSIECWGYDKPYGSEGYGWGATMPIHIIRSLIGFREENNPDVSGFSLCPNLPAEFLSPGKRYGIGRLKFITCQMELSYIVQADLRLECRFTIAGPNLAPIVVVRENGQMAYQSRGTMEQQEGSIALTNREKLMFQFYPARAEF
ncbi:MAG: MGH1-like glycoside hydrolase domain-containing protein [Candidatus Zhuqueibacterota bacterium]